MELLELFEYSPGLFVAILFVMLIITVLAYGAIPLIFAATRKAAITRKRYRVYCFILNFFVMIIFIALNGEAVSAGPYILWTGVFSSVGAKILNKKGCFAAAEEERKTIIHSPPAAEAAPLPSLDELNPAKPTIEECSVETNVYKYCPSCGFELLPNSRFCSACGNAIPVNEE